MNNDESSQLLSPGRDSDSDSSDEGPYADQPAQMSSSIPHALDFEDEEGEADVDPEEVLAKEFEKSEAMRKEQLEREAKAKEEKRRAKPKAKKPKQPKAPKKALPVTPPKQDDEAPKELAPPPPPRKPRRAPAAKKPAKKTRTRVVLPKLSVRKRREPSQLARSILSCKKRLNEKGLDARFIDVNCIQLEVDAKSIVGIPDSDLREQYSHAYNFIYDAVEAAMEKADNEDKLPTLLSTYYEEYEEDEDN